MERNAHKVLFGRSTMMAACLLVSAWVPGAHAQKVVAATGAKTAATQPTLNAEKSRADADWQTVLSPLLEAGEGISFVGRAANTGEANRITWEAYTRLLRKYGLEFYDKYPQDPRRLAWLPTAVGWQPRYWKDPKEAARIFETGMASRRLANAAGKEPGRYTEPEVEIDLAAKAAWAERYQNLRSEFFASQDYSNAERARLWMNELQVKRGEIMLRSRESDIPRLREDLFQDVLALGRYPVDWLVDYRDHDELARRRLDPTYMRRYELARDFMFTAGEFFTDPQDWKMDPKVEARYLDAYKTSPNELLQNLGYSKAQVASLKAHPYELRFTAMDGRDVDLSKMRGKVVLLEYWSTTCVGCIAQIPKLKRIYEKYHASGFEIIGLAYDSEAERQKVIEFERKNGITWPQRLDQAKQLEEFKKYSLLSVSTLILLDKNGQLISIGSSFGEEELDTLVRKHLGLDQKSSSATEN